MTADQRHAPASAPARDVTDDVALLKRVRDGDREAFVALLDRHGGRVYACALRGTGDAHAAQEITHDVFLSLQQRTVMLRGSASLGTWLFRVTVNRARDHTRRELRHERRAQRGGDALHGTAVAADRGLETADRARLVARALRELPSRTQEIVMLRYTADLDYATIAQTLGIPPGSVASQLHRGLQRLGAILRRNGVTESDL